MQETEDIVTRLERESDAWGSGSGDMAALCAEAATTIATLRAEVEGLRADADRYRWLRDLKCNSFSVSRDDDHACNYMTASKWIDLNPDDYRYDDPAEVQRMRDTNTIWRLQVYPHTPVGFNVWNASTLDAAIDAAKADKEGA